MAIFLIVNVIVWVIYGAAAIAGAVVLFIGYRLGRRLAGHGGAVMARVDVAIGAVALVAAVVLERVVTVLPHGAARLTFSYVWIAVIALGVLVVGMAAGRLRGRSTSAGRRA